MKLDDQTGFKHLYSFSGPCVCIGGWLDASSQRPLADWSRRGRPTGFPAGAQSPGLAESFRVAEPRLETRRLG